MRLYATSLATVLGIVVATLAAPAARPAAAQEQPGTQAVVVCPAEEAPNGIDVCVDRGDGAVYREGDAIAVCATWNIPAILIFPPPPAPTIRVTDSVDGGPPRLLFEEQSFSGQQCITGIIGAPFGAETVRGDVIGADGNLIASDTATFASVPGSSAAVGVSVAIDRGAGATYQVGDPILVCATITPAAGDAAYPVRLTDLVNGSFVGTFDLGTFVGQRCFAFNIAAPAGEEEVRIEALDPQTGAVLGGDAVTFFVAA